VCVCVCVCVCVAVVYLYGWDRDGDRWGRGGYTHTHTFAIDWTSGENIHLVHTEFSVKQVLFGVKTSTFPAIFQKRLIHTIWNDVCDLIAFFTP